MDPKGREKAAHQSRSTTALGTEAKRQNPARIDARSAWEVEGWLVDGFTHLWAQGIEEGRKDGDRSSSEWHGTARGRLLDVEERRPASEGNAVVGGGTG
jgi:hypothetical protein